MTAAAASPDEVAPFGKEIAAEPADDSSTSRSLRRREIGPARNRVRGRRHAPPAARFCQVKQRGFRRPAASNVPQAPPAGTHDIRPRARSSYVDVRRPTPAYADLRGCPQMQSKPESAERMTPQSTRRVQRSAGSACGHPRHPTMRAVLARRRPSTHAGARRPTWVPADAGEAGICGTDDAAVDPPRPTLRRLRLRAPTTSDHARGPRTSTSVDPRRRTQTHVGARRCRRSRNLRNG